MDEYTNKNYAVEAQIVGGRAGALTPLGKDYNPTIRENLDNRIAELQKQIAELERIKSITPDSLIDMKISDLREAMRF